MTVLAVAYAIGCLQLGHWMVRSKTGQDLRRIGSGSTGATNVGRVLGQTGFVLVMLADMVKGAAALGYTILLGVSAPIMALAILAVVAGHIFPIQLRFHGGKGLSPGFGALVVYDWRLAGLILASTALLWLAANRSRPVLCLAATLAATPALALLFGHPPMDAAFLAATIALILWAHKSNIVAAWHDRRTPQTKENNSIQ